ncbi:MAG: calcium/sodium antiporter [Candidatus Delongbacteria bacterium]|jgi:cation:H+ antiporter|nr:calcium/sodium antiporter [Candidatus Delongbacteria bacterium]
MTVQILLLILGFGILVKGADWLVDGASELARKYKISDLAIGLTVVAFGTSAPELIVNVFAAYQGHHDIVFGNIIGSNNFNLFIILGISGLIVPLAVQSSTVWKEIPFSLGAAVLLFILTSGVFFAGNNVLSRADGMILLVMFALFLYYVYKQLGNDKAQDNLPHKNFTPLKIWSFILIGLAGLVLGGKLVVSSAIVMAEALGVSQKIIGLTIVAAGTSLPELATSVVAAIKKNNDIAVGNIIGSNIFNIFLILGVSSLVNPVVYSSAFDTDLLMLGLGTVFLFTAMFTGIKGKLDRWEAAVLLVMYVAYTAYLVLKEF